MLYSDTTLTCRDCNSPFLWTAGEQAFYKERGLLNLPVRCVACRSTRREKLGLHRQTVTEVSCASCGVKTTVPFVPRNGKPIYCSHCLVEARLREEAEEAAASSASAAGSVEP